MPGGIFAAARSIAHLSGETQLPRSILRHARLRMLVLVVCAASGMATVAPAAAPASIARLPLHNPDSNCAAFGVQPRAAGRVRLVVISRCEKVTVLVCAFRPAPGPAAWDCQQPSFSSANQRRGMPYDQSPGALYYVGACVRHNWDCENSLSWLYSSIAARRDNFDPRALRPPAPPPRPPIDPAERG